MTSFQTRLLFSITGYIIATPKRDFIQIKMTHFFAKVIIFTLFLGALSNAEFLSVSGKDFYYGQSKVFLSGTNIAWNSYGYDFGNDNYANSGPILEQWIREIALAGGNILRIWLHIEGDDTPLFDSQGNVTGTDRLGNLIRDLETFLDVSAQNNVFVIPVLWNGALMRNTNFVNLVLSDEKLQTYIDNALRPMVRQLASKPALAAWEVMNEPEGSALIESNANRCYDTTIIGRWGAGWTGANIPMERFLRFINRQNAAIRQEDPKVLITLGSWSEHSQTDAFSDSVNHYTDSCLIGAGGEQEGTIDFYQMHTYSWEGRWSDTSPFKIPATAYQLTKPIVIGEFSSVCGENEGVDTLWYNAYNSAYQGIWSWQYNAGGHCSDTKADQNRGMTHIRNFAHNGQIPVNIQ
ncbi:mannan endo-1,4-beta-mannosidase [Folsomia candida]|uniref:Mannan endo-1,4-beta-mannosidase n=1 Tax=Folsomia candida TaxID=158441 RepID=A0A226F6V4_FOLCA|nr:mannan endo-1,4-beta-mannosidase [Folsomia candida]OXA64941.1 Mannan endo-1,4-beta-mannosidase [Folsomia candida]